MLRIELVRMGGRLVGRTVSDRFNLSVLGIGCIHYDRNQKALKRLRRILAGQGFLLSATPKLPFIMRQSHDELRAMGYVTSQPPRGEFFAAA